MPWSYLLLNFQCAYRVQSKKNDHVLLVLLSLVNLIIQSEIIHWQRKFIVQPWMLLPLLTCLDIWVGFLQLPLPSRNHCQTLVWNHRFPRILSSHVSYRISAKANIKNKNNTGAMIFPCLTPTSWKFILFFVNLAKIYQNLIQSMNIRAKHLWSSLSFQCFINN